jgi:hypothetical protein
MATKKTKTCQICKTPFKARRDAKTCSSACRKRLERGLKAQAAEKANRLESALGREFHRVAAGLLKNHVIREPFVLADERGGVPVSVLEPPPASSSLDEHPDPVIPQPGAAVKPAPAASEPTPAPAAPPAATTTEETPAATASQTATETSTAPKAMHLEDVMSTETLEPSAFADAEAMEPADSDKPPTGTPSTRERFMPFHFNKLAFLATGLALLAIIVVGGGSLFLTAKHNTASSKTGAPKPGDFAVSSLPLGDVKANQQLLVGQANQITINGQLQLNDTLVLSPTTEPTSPVIGQVYFDQTAKAPFYYDGTQFVSLAPQQHVTSLGGASDVIGLGNGLSVVNNQLDVSGSLLQQINNAANAGVLSLAGTVNQVNVSSTTGNITLSLPQDIAVTSTPTFGGQTLNGQLVVTSGGANITGSVTLGNLGTGLVLSSGSGVLSSGTVDRNDANYLSGTLSVANGGTGAGSFTSNGILYGNGSGTLQVTASAANSVLVTNGAGVPSLSQTLPLQVQDNITHTGVLNSGSITAGFGTISTVNNISTTALIQAGSLQVDGGSFTVDNSGNFIAAGTGAVQGAGGLTLGVAGSTTGSLNLANATSTRQVVLQGLNPSGAGNVTIQIPTIVGGSTDTVCLVTLGNCAGSGGGIIGSGTVGTIAMFDAGNSITNSTLTQSGSTVTASGNVIIQGSNALTLGTASTNYGAVSFKNAANANTLTLQSGITTGNLTLTLPVSDGTNGQCLKTNGTAALGFADCTGGAGGGVTSLNGLTGVISLANANGVGSTITIDNAKADASTKGIATFNATNFSDNGFGTINTIQNIALLSTPTFAGLTLNGTSTSSALNILQTGSNPVAGQALILANNNTVTPSGNLLDLQNKGTSELHVDVSGNLTTIGNIQGVGITSTGTITVGTLGTTDTSSILCRNSGNIIAACSGSGSGAPFVQGGNSFGATATLGTNDNFGLNIRTNGATAVSISNTGQIAIGPAAVPANGVLTIGTDTTAATGGLYFGTDTNLYRSAANVLSTDDRIAAAGFNGVAFLSGGGDVEIGRASATNLSFDTYVTGDSTSRFNIQADGKLLWGPGNAALDTNLYRSAVGTLKTDGNLVVAGSAALTLGTASTNTGKIVLQGSGGAGTLTLAGPTTPNVGNFTLTIPAITGNANVCTDNSVCTGYAPSTLGTGYIQNGTTTQTNANFNIQSAAAGSVGAVIQGAVGQTADLLDLKTSTPATVLSVGATGATLFQNSADSATAFQIQNAAGTNILNLDTSNTLVTITGVAAGTGSQTFNYTGGSQTFTVPSGVTSINLTLYGASGGTGGQGNNGGTGGQTTGTLAVTPGQVLTIYAGGAGSNGTAAGVGGGAGYNGGGAGGNAYSSSYPGGAGGGGASMIKNGATVEAAAGGGAGGAGNGSGSTAAGGNGGNTTGNTGNSTRPGTGGTQSAGGTGYGSGSSVYCGTPATNGSSGQGGAGGIGTGGLSGASGSGGGGGGYYGGGGGDCGTATGNGGGGGGSGYSALLTGASMTTGGNSGNGQIAITWVAPPTFKVNDASGNTNFSVNSYTGSTIVQGNSTTAFQVQNAAGNNYIQVDTSGANLYLGNGGIASTIQIGNTTGAVAQTINIGNNATASSTNTVVIGSTIGTSPVTIQSGTSGVLAKGANSSTAFQIQNASSQTLLVANTTAQQVAVGPAAVPANGVLTVGANTTTSAGGLYLGTDTDLYRSAASTLTTDGGLNVAGNALTVVGASSGSGAAGGSGSGVINDHGGGGGGGIGGAATPADATCNGDNGAQALDVSGLFAVVSGLGYATVSPGAGYGVCTNPGGGTANGNPATGFGSGGGGANYWGGMGGNGLYGGGGGGAAGESTANRIGGTGGQGVVVINPTGGTNVVETSGTSYTVPAGITSIKIWAVGAGGGGAGGTNAQNSAGGAGGAGGVAYQTFAVTPGATISYSLGTAGAGGTGATNGTGGGSTTVTMGAVTVTANGGSGGQYNNNATGAGGSFSNGSSGLVSVSVNLNVTGNSAVFQNATNSTTAFQIQNAAGTSIFNVDTTNSKVGTANTTLASTNSAALTLQSGNASGTTSNSGSVTIDSGTATGTAGNISIGTGAYAHNVTIGNTTGTSSVTINSGSAGVLVKGANSTTAFQVQNNSSNEVLTVDTSNNKLILGKASTVNGTIDFKSSSSANTVTLQAGATGATNPIFTLPTADGSTGQCLQTNGSGQFSFGACTSAGTTGTMQQVYDTGASLTTSSGRDIAITLADSATDSNFLINTAASSTSKFAVQNAGTDVFSITNVASAEGSALFKNKTNNTTGFQIQNSGGTAMLTADTTNTRLYVGVVAGSTTGTPLVLSNDTDATYNAGTATNAPTEVDGAMFYSSTNHSFLCGAAGSWETCTGLLYSNTSAPSAVNTCTTACTAFNVPAAIPANYCQAGRVIHLVARGVWSTVSNSIAFGIYYGTDGTTKTNDVLLGSATQATLANFTVTNVGWSVDTTIICFDTTHMMAETVTTTTVNATATTTNAVYTTGATSSTSVTSTSAKNLYIFPAFSTSAAGDTATLEQLVVTGN